MKKNYWFRCVLVIAVFSSVPLSVAGYFSYAGALKPVDKQLTNLSWADATGVTQSLHDERYPLTFLISGFVHCVDFCSQRVRELRSLDEKLPSALSGVRFLWLNVDNGKVTEAQRYKYFDQHSSRFFSLEIDAVLKQNLLNELGQNEAIKDPTTHLARLYLTDQYGKILRLYTQKSLPIDKIVEAALMLRKSDA